MKVILDKTFLLHPSDSKTNVHIPFSLDRNYHSLEFKCHYEPKKCEDPERAKELIREGAKIYIPMEYRGGLGAIEDYLPSVVNLITLSLDSPFQYVGCAHRHTNDLSHIISRDFSSPGFFPHLPAQGGWKAMLNVHLVVSPEVKYHLQISAHDEEIK